MCDIYGTLFLIQAIIYSDENQKEIVLNVFSWILLPVWNQFKKKKPQTSTLCMCLILFPSPRPTLDHMLCQIEIKMQSNPIDFSEITCDSVPYICLNMCFIGYNRQKLFMTQISWTFTGTISTLKGRRK